MGVQGGVGLQDSSILPAQAEGAKRERWGGVGRGSKEWSLELEKHCWGSLAKGIR